MTKQAELKQQAYASSLKSRALSVLIYLIDRSNEDLTCFPAIPTMAEQLHISISTVKRALKELIDAGYIQKEARFRERNHGQSSNLYTLLFVEQGTMPDNDNSHINTDRDDIDLPATSDAGRVAGYINFEILAESDTHLKSQKNEKTTELEERQSSRNYAISMPDSSVDTLSLLPQYVFTNQPKQLERTKISRSFYTDSSKWTGVGIILHPP